MVSFTRNFPVSTAEVWRAVSDPEHLVAWFPHRVAGDLTTPGAELRFEETADGAPAFEGSVVAVESGRLLEFRWGTDLLRFELTAVGQGCAFTLTDTFEELGKAARDAAGWHTCLDFLEVALEGNTPKFSMPERWREVHPGYVEAFGAEASMIGPSDPALDE
jgi:uncharacterized protein YndB with AHSA1/START domain